MSATHDTTVIEPDQPSAGRSVIRTALVAAGAVLAAVLLWFFVVQPLLVGDASEPDLTAAAPADPATSEPAVDAATDPALTAEEGAPAADGELQLVTYELLLERDPFDPVVPRPVSETTPTGAGSDPTSDGVITTPTDGTHPDGTNPDGTDADGGDGTTDGTPTDGEPTDGGTVPEEPTAPVGCGDTTEDGAVCDGRAISLIKISETTDGRRVAVIQVDSTIYEVEKGEVFAANFRVGSITSDRVTVSYGDDVIELRQGDRVMK